MNSTEDPSESKRGEKYYRTLLIYCEGFTYVNCFLPHKTMPDKPFFTAPQI